MEQEYQESLIQGKIHNQLNLNKGLRLLVKLCFRESYDSNLSGLQPFDYAHNSWSQNKLKIERL